MQEYSIGFVGCEQQHEVYLCDLVTQPSNKKTLWFRVLVFQKRIEKKAILTSKLVDLTCKPCKLEKRFLHSTMGRKTLFGGKIKMAHVFEVGGMTEIDIYFWGLLE